MNHDNLAAIAYAALAEMEHNACSPSDNLCPAEIVTEAPEPDDAKWAAETSPSNTPSRQEALVNIGPQKADQIYQTMPNFEEWDTHRLIAWFYAIDYTLRERLS